jgi:hypothetical protein
VPTRFDPFLDDADLRRAYRALVDGRWDDFDKMLGQEHGGWLLRSILTSDDAAVETIVFRRFADARPSALALSLLGGALARDAMGVEAAAGGSGIAGRSAAAGDGPGPALADAERILRQAANAEPALADPWVHLLASGRGLGIDLGDLRTRYEQAHSREPFRADACRAYLLALRDKSAPAMFDFAHWVEREAPPDSPAREVLPRAHLELGLSLAHGASLSAYLARPETAAELVPALASFLEAAPQPARPADLPTLSAYGLAMTVSNHPTARLTRECFRRIDNRPTSYPWSLYPGETITAVFAEVQRTQLHSADRVSPIR